MIYSRIQLMDDLLAQISINFYMFTDSSVTLTMADNNLVVKFLILSIFQRPPLSWPMAKGTHSNHFQGH
jgi:hypothetical protein